jgi:xanthine dehydrogenase iron-sulfur cluster and FAD-binding subunit A
MIMGVVGLLEEKPDATDSDISSRMQKHLCRCCSYPRITKAIRRAVGSAPKAAYDPPIVPKTVREVGRVWQDQPGLPTAPSLSGGVI